MGHDVEHWRDIFGYYFAGTRGDSGRGKEGRALRRLQISSCGNGYDLPTHSLQRRLSRVFKDSSRADTSCRTFFYALVQVVH